MYSSCYETQQQSFFERLPYDVRVLIYTFLEPGDLPPFTRGFQSSTLGFYLSCRRAKQDFDDLAIVSFSKYLSKFTDLYKSSTKLDIVVTTSPIAPLRHITITIPYASLENFHPKTEDKAWKRKVLIGLHALLSLYFDTLRIHFSGTENQPCHETLLDRGNVEVSMHRRLRDITYMIERGNKKKSNQASGIQSVVSVTDIFKYVPGQRAQAYPDANVNVSRITLSWDLRPEQNSEEKASNTLNGKIYCIPMLNTGMDAKTEGTFFYHLRDEQRLAGEMGVGSKSRWILSDNPQIVALLNCVDTRAEYCSKAGFDAMLVDGLDGISESDFEESEEEVGRLIYD